MTVLQLLLAVLLLLGNAFFVGAEFAVVSVRRSQIEPLAEAGHKRARTVLHALSNVSAMLAAAQLGITVCSLGLGALAEPTIAALLEGPFHAIGVPPGLMHALSYGISLALVVFLHMVMGEMVPKNMAMAGPERAALWLGPPLEEALGRLRYLALYLLAGLGGSTFAFLVAGDWMNSVGASGAVFGLIGATIVMQLRNRGPLAPAVAFLVFNLVVTFSRQNIDWRAHIGGLVVGGLVALGLMCAPRERRGAVQALTVVGAAAVEAAMLLGGMALYGA